VAAAVLEEIFHSIAQRISGGSPAKVTLKVGEAKAIPRPGGILDRAPDKGGDVSRNTRDGFNAGGNLFDEDAGELD
jgi:hypothetical protein